MNGPCDDLCCWLMCLSWCCVAEEISENNRYNRQIRRENAYLRQQQYQQYNQPKVVYVAQPQTAVAYQQGYAQPVVQQQQIYQAPPPVVVVENRAVPSAPGLY